MSSILAVITFIVLFAILCRCISYLCNKKNDIKCPKCGETLHYHITEEMNEDGLRYVDYRCKNCGWKVRLP